MEDSKPNGSFDSQSSCGNEFTISELRETSLDYGRKFTEAASRAGDYVSDKVSSVGNKIKDLQGKDFNEIADQAKDYARKNPGQAILISAAAGVLLGFLLRGGRR